MAIAPQQPPPPVIVGGRDISQMSGRDAAAWRQSWEIQQRLEAEAARNKAIADAAARAEEQEQQRLLDEQRRNTDTFFRNVVDTIVTALTPEPTAPSSASTAAPAAPASAAAVPAPPPLPKTDTSVAEAANKDIPVNAVAAQTAAANAAGSYMPPVAVTSASQGSEPFWSSKKGITLMVAGAVLAFVLILKK